MLRKFLLVSVLAAAATGPVALYSASGWWSRIKGAISSVSGTKTQEAHSVADSAAQTELPHMSREIPLEGAPVDNLVEVLRFDVTTGWVMARWPRVSSSLAELQLQGYRVPLVTGTEEDDFAGVLTYYFNPRQEVQRITFSGATGNAHKLVDLATRRFGFVRRIINNAGMYLYEVPEPRGPAKSVLSIRPARVLKSSQPYQRFEVAMTIERPEGTRSAARPKRSGFSLLEYLGIEEPQAQGMQPTGTRAMAGVAPTAYPNGAPQPYPPMPSPPSSSR